MFEDLKEKLVEYVDTPIEDITEETRFIEDLGMNSFQFMSLLGYLEEDTFMGNALRQDPHFTAEVQNEQNNSMVFYLEQLHKEVL